MTPTGWRAGARALATLAIAATACGGDDDPCAGVDRACVAVRVTSSTLDRLDELQLDLLYGDRHDTLRVARGGPFTLPAVTAVELDLDPAAGATLPVELVIAGRVSGVALGTGAAAVALAAGQHASVEVRLAPPADCDDGRLYCGGQGVAGAAATLYRCNVGTVPTARGRCPFGCLVRTGDDVCDGGPAPCVAGTYCGGDKVDGDPQALYTCQSGSGTNPVVCPDRCVVAAPGFADFCE